jgi:hypothetical protein
VLFTGSSRHRPYFAAGHTRLSAVLTSEKHNLDEGVEPRLTRVRQPECGESDRGPVLSCHPMRPFMRYTRRLQSRREWAE